MAEGLPEYGTEDRGRRMKMRNLLHRKKYSAVMGLVFICLSMIWLSGCGKEETGEQTKGSFGYEMTYDASQVYFKGDESYDYFQCKDTIDTAVGQGIRVTRYESDYSFDVVVNAINMESERGLDVNKVIIGKKAYPAYMVRITFPGEDGNIYTEVDYQVEYKDSNIRITAVYDVEHSAIIESMIKTLEFPL
jgi:hypothetical protein